VEQVREKASLTSTKDRQELGIEMWAQPDEVTCGPTCLQAVYRYYGEVVAIEDLCQQVVALPSGGTLAVLLANHALDRGYQATIHTCNLQVFDPTWFDDGVNLEERLHLQENAKEDIRLEHAIDGYLSFLSNGGRLRFGAPSPEDIYRSLSRGVPILTGLSATYLYRAEREYLDKPDDIRGTPVGHFVVVSGMDPESGTVCIADPLGEHSPGGSLTYWVETSQLIASILLGVLTYDANILLIEPRAEAAADN
jgi:hypothetical protein